MKEAWSALRGRGQDSRDANLAALMEAERGSYGRVGSVTVTQERALRHSAVWACLRLRANLVSSMPIDAFRKSGSLQVEVAKPEFLVTPYPGVSMPQWMFGSQYDLDRYGNVWGIVHARNAFGLPAVVELAPSSEVSVSVRRHRISQVRVSGEVIKPEHLWHEAQYTPAGHTIGLSPIQAAAWSIGSYLSAQEYSLDWYSQDGAQPRGVLRNTEMKIVKPVAREAKEQFKAAARNRDIFVTGKDWEWNAEKVDAQSAGFMEQMRWGVQDVCRFLDVPGDLIDAAPTGSSVTYANITQRHVQFLVMALGAPIQRREEALSACLPKPRFVKLNTDALLRMDPQTRQTVFASRITSRVMAPSEARALDNLPPFTEEQLAEFDRLFPRPGNPAPTQKTQQQITWEVPA